MKRALEFTETSSSKTVPPVDQVVESLAIQLAWRGEDRDETDYEGAFAELDEKLAQTERTESAVLVQFPRKDLHDRLMRPAADQPGPCAGGRPFNDVFGLLEEISTLRRRSRPSEDRRLIAALLDDARRLCTVLDLPSARVRVEFATETLATNHFEMGRELDELARHIRYDLRLCSAGTGTRAVSPR